MGSIAVASSKARRDLVIMVTTPGVGAEAGGVSLKHH
jgi:hypothetical protein